MPELPEVETIRIGLSKYLVGKIIEDIDIRLSKQITGDIAIIIGLEIMAVRRFGKGLVIDLQKNFSIAIHIKMTGQLIYRGEETENSELSEKVGGNLPHKYTHVIFKLKVKSQKSKMIKSAYLYYNDIRQFGWIKIIKTNDLKILPFFKELGPEPLNNLTLEQFSTILKKKKTAIKPLLMDQKIIAGIGNIYANDALFLARIHPKRQASSLSEKEIKQLFESIETVLKKGLEAGGASEWQYVNAEGQTGGYQNFFQVYGKDGKPCTFCGTKIERIILGGRGTFFCPHCQK